MSLERDEDEQEKPAPRTRSVGWRVVVLVLVLFGAFAALWNLPRLNPFATDQRNIRESQEIMETTRSRSLTDAEIERLVALLHSGTETAQLSAVITLEIAVGREPARRDRAVAALEGCPETASPMVRHEASQAAARLKTPQKEADELSDKALHRPLTDDEFDRLIALLHSGTEAVQLSAILTFQIVVGRDPSRLNQVIAALEGCPETASPMVHHEARQVATRLKRPQNQP